MTKSLSSFRKYSDGAFESKVHTILSSMNGNANFPNPVPDLSLVSAASTAYSDALIAASTGNRVSIALKNSRREELTTLLRSLCTYVNLTGNGNRSILLSSGFDISKEREPRVITKPENLEVTNGQGSGELIVSVNAVKGAYAYLHEYTTDQTMAPGNWSSIASTTAKTLITSLQSGVKYYCRVGAIGPNSQLLYSDPVARIVL